MQFKNIFKRLLSQDKPKDLLPYTGEITTKDSLELDKIREESELKAKNSIIPSHIVCRAIELKIGDVIIHDYRRFKISECGCGFGALNEFGHYFWIKGNFVNGNPTDQKPLEDFWSSQECPVIKLC